MADENRVNLGVLFASESIAAQAIARLTAAGYTLVERSADDPSPDRFSYPAMGTEGRYRNVRGICVTSDDPDAIADTDAWIAQIYSVVPEHLTLIDV